jgi:hypothetical protein
VAKNFLIAQIKQGECQCFSVDVVRHDTALATAACAVADLRTSPSRSNAETHALPVWS